MTAVAPRTGRADDEVVHRYTCPLCECMCGLDIYVSESEQRVTLIRGAKDDVYSKGYICPKGSALGHLHHDPDRLRSPMVRDGDQWREVSWDEAFARCEELLAGLTPEDATVFVGNPVGHRFSLSRYVGQVAGQAGITRTYSSGTVDQWPKNVVSILLYGNMWLFPAPDIARTDYFLCMGGNPEASGGSLLGSPDVLSEIDALRARGGKVVVVDPRRTKTADRATEWLPIQPGADAAWLLALLQVTFEEGLDSLGDIADMVDGYDAVRALCRPFTPEAVAEFTRIPAETTRRIAREIAAAPAAAIYGRIGLCNQEFGTLATWLIDVLAICTGNFDRPGGQMFGNPLNFPIHLLASTKVNGPATFGRWKSRVRGAPEVLGQVPASCMAEEIATPGPGQIRALVTVAANPVISSPDAGKLKAALPQLQCMIAVDNYLNETSQFAHVILPGVSPLEEPHYDELLWVWASRSAGKWSDPVFEPPAGQPDEWEILIRLGQLLAGKRNDEVDIAAADDAYFANLCRAKGLDPDAILPLYDHGGPERMVDWGIRVGPFGDRYGERPGGLTLADLKAAPDGIDMGPAIPRAREAVCTPDGRIDLVPEYIVADLPRLQAKIEAGTDGMVLVSRRHLRSKNSWLHNAAVLVRGKDRCTLLVNPDDAARIGLVDGGVARITSEAASIEAPVEVTDEMMPGVVCLPHGWGHDEEGARLSIAREHAGVNNNLLAPGTFVDVPSGNAAVNGIPVEVTAVP